MKKVVKLDIKNLPSNLQWTDTGVKIKITKGSNMCHLSGSFHSQEVRPEGCRGMKMKCINISLLGTEAKSLGHEVQQQK